MGFKLPTNLETLAKSHGYSKAEVEAFANKHGVTGIQQGGSSGPKPGSSPDDILAQGYHNTSNIKSDQSFYSDKKRDKAKKKSDKGYYALSKAREARSSGNERKAERLENKAARKFAGADKKMNKAKMIENRKKL